MLPSSSSHSAVARPAPRSLSAPASLAGRLQSRAAPAVFSIPAREPLTGWNYNDSHFHPTQYTQQGRSPGALFADMDSLDIRCTTLMPIPTNVLSSQPELGWSPCSGRHHCGPSYYLPPRLMQGNTLSAEDMAEARQATELYINTGVDSTTALRYQQLTAAQKKRLDPMITGLHLGDMHSSTYLLQKLHQHPGVLPGWARSRCTRKWSSSCLPASARPT
ncbi:MAG: hypothetical protein ABWY05_11820 [Noviherbaspirillum sp.]